MARKRRICGKEEIGRMEWKARTFSLYKYKLGRGNVEFKNLVLDIYFFLNNVCICKVEQVGVDSILDTFLSSKFNRNGRTPGRLYRVTRYTQSLCATSV